MKKKKTQMWKMWNQDCEVRVKNEHLLAIPGIDRMITRRAGVFSFVLLSSGVRANAELASLPRGQNSFSHLWWGSTPSLVCWSNGDTILSDRISSSSGRATHFYVNICCVADKYAR